jgi:hypothetical protein
VTPCSLVLTLCSGCKVKLNKQQEASRKVCCLSDYTGSHPIGQSAEWSISIRHGTEVAQNNPISGLTESHLSAIHPGYILITADNTQLSNEPFVSALTSIRTGAGCETSTWGQRLPQATTWSPTAGGTAPNQFTLHLMFSHQWL